MADELTPKELAAAGDVPCIDPGMTRQQYVSGQMQEHVPSVHPVQPPPPQYYPPQHHPPQHHLPPSAYGAPGQHRPQIPEFTVPVDHHRSTTVIVNQPQILQPAPPQLYVPDEMGFSIFTTLCCFFYLGIPAMIFASQANSLRYIHPERALAKAKVARSLNIAAVILGVIAIIVVVVLYFSVPSKQSYN